MRRCLLVMVLFAVSGCGLFGPDSIAGIEVADEIRPFFATTAGTEPRTLTCEDILAEVGARTSCTATDVDGRHWPMTAVVAKVDEDVITYTPRFDERVVDNFTVQANIARELETKTHRYYKRVTCTGIQKLAVNTNRTCTVTETNDNVWNVDYTIIDLNGGARVTLQDSVLYAGTVESIVKDLAQRLSRHYGLATGLFPRSNANCPNMLRGRTGDSVRCTAVLSDDSRVEVTVRTTELSFDKIHFELHPDNAPDLSLTGWHVADPS